MQAPRTAEDYSVVLPRVSLVLLVTVLFFYGVAPHNNGSGGYANLSGLAETTYPLLGIIGLLALGGVVASARRQPSPVDRQLNARLAASTWLALGIVAGLSLIPFTQEAFGYSQYGFPLVTTAVACGEVSGVCHATSSLPPFLANYLFTILLAYPIVSLVQSYFTRRPWDQVSLGLAVSSSLTFGAFLGLVGLVWIDAAIPITLYDLLGRYYFMPFCLFPNLVVAGAALHVKATRLGITTIAAGMVLVAFLTLVV